MLSVPVFGPPYSTMGRNAANQLTTVYCKMTGSRRIPLNSGFMLSVAIRIGVLGLFERPVQSPYLVSESQSLLSKSTNLRFVVRRKPTNLPKFLPSR
jgi:hypothetical protein